MYVLLYFAQFLLEWEMFQTKIVEKLNIHDYVQNCFSKVVPFMRQWGKILQSQAGHRWQYGACTLHAGYLRLLTHAYNMEYLLLFHCNGGCMNTPHVTLHIHCIPCLYLLMVSSVFHAHISSICLCHPSPCVIHPSVPLSSSLFVTTTHMCKWVKVLCVYMMHNWKDALNLCKS